MTNLLKWHAKQLDECDSSLHPSVILEVTHAAEKRMALEALRSEFNSGQKSAVDRVAALEEEVGWHMAQ